MATKHYAVRLEVPTVMWAIVEVEAKNEDEARSKALRASAEGGTGDLPPVFYEYGGFDNCDAEVTDVEECEPNSVNSVRGAESS